MDDDLLVNRSEQLAAALLRRAGTVRTRAERARQRQVAAMVTDVASRDFMIELTDEVLRIEEPAAAARRFARLVEQRGLPGFVGPLDRLLLRAAVVASRVVPGLVVDQLRRRVRRELASVVLDSAPGPLAKELHERRAQGSRAQGSRVQGSRVQGFQLNVNPLGEAVLGADEAAARLDQALELLARPGVEYVSVKASAICAGLDVLDLDGSVARIAEAFGRLVDGAARRDPAPFVNLDMEEYADLWPTIRGFTTALDHPGRRDFRAGIVVQAYLPDSPAAFDELAGWARERVAAGGAPVKVRLVKGANLAMEHVDAQLHGWGCATFGSKEAVDANYKRLLDRALDPELDGVLRVGVASHNLFDIAWALTLAAELSELERVDIEMLHGMAEAEAQAVVERLVPGQRMVLYTPVVDPADFTAATAYLVRRFDENTAPQNFLTHLPGLDPESAAWDEQRKRFRVAVHDRKLLPEPSRRAESHPPELPGPRSVAEFTNQPDLDPTQPPSRNRFQAALADFRFPQRVTARVAGTDVTAGIGVRVAVDPSTGRAAYEWLNLGVADVERAVATGLAASSRWRAKPPSERREVLDAVAATMQERRFETLATMAFDAGKTVHEADPEVSEAIDFARYYGRSQEPAGFVPYRLVVVAAPWNFPFAIPAGGVFAGLAAGSSVILKPAPETILVARLLAEQCWAAGVPQDVLQFVLTDDDDAGRRLITHEDVDAVVLTGSSATAGLFRSWRPDLRLHAETSGKNAIIVTAGADLDEAIRDIVRSAFGHAGQKCSAASLVLVADEILDQTRFLDRLADAVRSLRVGPGYDPATQMGPLVREPEGDLLRALTRLEEGETWLVEPRRLNANPLAWTPGVKLGVRPGSHFHLTECFGPVLGVMRVGGLDQAVAVANAIPYGLTAGLFSLDTAEIDRWSDTIEAGNLYVNRHITGAIVARQPFGGWKGSSIGPGIKAGGPFYVGSLGVAGALDGPPGQDFFDRVGQLWRHWSAGEDVSGLAAEQNLLRLRALPSVLLRVQPDARPEQVGAAGRIAISLGVRLELSGPDQPVDEFLERAETHCRVRLLGTAPAALLAAAAAAGVDLDRRPMSADPLRELLCWTREQAISRTLHRHGNLRS